MPPLITPAGPSANWSCLKVIDEEGSITSLARLRNEAGFSQQVVPLTVTSWSAGTDHVPELVIWLPRFIVSGPVPSCTADVVTAMCPWVGLPSPSVFTPPESIRSEVMAPKVGDAVMVPADQS